MPGCAPESQLLSLPQPCTPPVHLSTWRRPLRNSFRRLFSSRSSRQILAGLQTGLPAVAAGCPASMDQSEGLERRALSLGRDYIDVVVLKAPW